MRAISGFHVALWVSLILSTAANAQSACLPSATAEPMAGAMVRLSVADSCQQNGIVTIHHNGMMISERLDASGELEIEFPVFSDVALFMTEFANGTVSVASAEVSSIAFYDRVGVQWKGNSGLGLHAFEFGAEFGQEGHVWNEAPQTIDRAALGQGGFMISLGDQTIEDGMRAVVYTFPSATIDRQGKVILEVEAEVTQENCGKEIEAQTLQIGLKKNLLVRELTMTMPDCETVGDFILLNDLVDPLNIGAN